MKKKFLMIPLLCLMLMPILSEDLSNLKFINNESVEKKILGKWNVEGIPVEFTRQYVSTLFGVKFYSFKENDSKDLVFAVVDAKPKKDSLSLLTVGRIRNGEIKHASNVFFGIMNVFTLSFYGDDCIIFDNRFADDHRVLKATRINKAEQLSTTKQADIEEYISLTGDVYLKETIKALIEEVHKKYKDVPQKAWDEIAIIPDSKKLFAFLVPIYGKYFTQNEIREMNVFFKSQAWKKYQQVVKQIGEDCLTAGRKLREDTFLYVEKQLKAKGYLK